MAIMIALLTTTELRAQDIETLVMPGEVILGHAEYETECSSCHKMFDKAGQRKLCLDCHEDVYADVTAMTGFHGKHEEASSSQCSSCHTEHEGRDATVVILDEDEFDHKLTDFELVGSHKDAACGDCHADDERHRDAGPDCESCHIEDEPHEKTMGSNCGDCHKPTDWLEAKFDHDDTEYPLLGKHLEAACLDCHEDRTFPKPANTCYDCHAQDDAHDGRSGNACGDCHNPTDWHDSSFDHFRDTDFDLLGRHAELSCNDCHSDDPFQDEMDMACVTCHLEDDEHDGHRGEQCDTCHSSENDWSKPIFDHDADTDYPLLGGHLEASCNDCHVEPIFAVELTASCSSCHLDDDPHDESLGLQCENCHTEVNWQDPVFFDHNFTRFPLLGKHKEPECDDCHETQAFSETESDCSACHVDDDPHRGNFPQTCNDCHNPVGWDMWTFDHDTQTRFALAGAHADVACEECHRSSIEKMNSVASSCASCHRTDDIHDGEFGANCGRCHTANSFSEVRTLQ